MLRFFFFYYSTRIRRADGWTGRGTMIALVAEETRITENILPRRVVPRPLPRRRFRSKNKRLFSAPNRYYFTPTVNIKSGGEKREIRLPARRRRLITSWNKNHRTSRFTRFSINPLRQRFLIVPRAISMARCDEWKTKEKKNKKIKKK